MVKKGLVTTKGSHGQTRIHYPAAKKYEDELGDLRDLSWTLH
jgi:hypothetical protein